VGALNFRAGTIDVFDHGYNPATTDGGFADPNIPAGFAPFNIKSIDGDLFVTYGLFIAPRRATVWRVRGKPRSSLRNQQFAAEAHHQGV
jgi:hypothetical protein